MLHAIQKVSLCATKNSDGWSTIKAGGRVSSTTGAIRYREPSVQSRGKVREKAGEREREREK